MCGDVATTEIRCKGIGIISDCPLNFSDPAKNPLFVTNIANFSRRNIRTFHHFAIIVVRKVLIHLIAPFTDKLPLELAERERNAVTFYTLNSTYYKYDFKGLFYYGVGNVVVFIFVTIHSANLLRVKGFWE